MSSPTPPCSSSIPSHAISSSSAAATSGSSSARCTAALAARSPSSKWAPRLVQREDEDVSAAIKSFLEKEGIHVRLNAECIHFSKSGEDSIVHVDCKEDAPEIPGSHVLLAVGRRPNTDDLGLDKAGLTVDSNGYIPIDDQLRTVVPGIWALGDCNPKGGFTHTAYNDFEIAAANILDNDPRRVSDRIPCYALYTDPPLGRIGLTEEQVRKSGKPALIGTRPHDQGRPRGRKG